MQTFVLATISLDTRRQRSKLDQAVFRTGVVVDLAKPIQLIGERLAIYKVTATRAEFDALIASGCVENWQMDMCARVMRAQGAGPKRPRKRKRIVEPKVVASRDANQHPCMQRVTVAGTENYFS